MRAPRIQKWGINFYYQLILITLIFDVPYFREQFPRKLFFFGTRSEETIQGRKVFKGGNYSFLEFGVLFPRQFSTSNQAQNRLFYAGTVSISTQVIFRKYLLTLFGNCRYSIQNYNYNYQYSSEETIQGRKLIKGGNY